MSAKRLPGKPLLKLNGKSIITHVLNKAKDCKIGNIMVATEDKVILNEVQNNGFKAVLTSKKHKSGTDRIWEAFQKVRDKKIKYIINLQGDEPLIDPKDIEYLIKNLSNSNFDIVTLAHKIGLEDAKNPSRVKVISNKNNQAISFSRNLIPFGAKSFMQHVGIYGFTKKSLELILRLFKLANIFLNRSILLIR